MSRKPLCIHGHFYQPPRENPWMDLVQPEGTAAPSANWNERIVKQSYAPLGWARRLDEQGRITELINCYEWMSFNIGPTLLAWLERHSPDVYARVLEADRRSVLRFGHGNAMAQVYHHAIMPLMSELDKEVEVVWAVQDFTARFGRPPEGMWLAETAVDTATLEVLADHGITFTILAPRQAAALYDEENEGQGWRGVAEHEVDITRPWQVDLPSGRDLSVFFYNGPLSRSVAFEGLLKDGEKFWRRLAQAAENGLTSIGTDGETYGHHYQYGEMALAYVLDMARSGRDGVRLTNYASFLTANPPTGRVRLHEPSSWSCVHGVERWRSDCGCTDGGHPGWQQKWRTPFRKGLDELKLRIDEHYFSTGEDLFKNSRDALLSFGVLVSGSGDLESFRKLAFKSGINLENFQTGISLLLMQKWALSMFASCAWFFDDMARVEPRNAMVYALRAMELAEKTGAGDLRPAFVKWLEQAPVNDDRFATGGDVWRAEVLPRVETPASLVAQALLTLATGGGFTADGKAKVSWPGLDVVIACTCDNIDCEIADSGTAELLWQPGGGGPRCSWKWHGRDAVDIFAGSVEVREGGGQPLSINLADLFWKNRELAAMHWMRSHEGERWEELVERGAAALPFFLEYRAYQSGPVDNAQWLSLWQELTAAYVVCDLEGPGAHGLVEFLRHAREGHPGAAWIETRLGIVLAELVACRAGVESVAAFVERARNIGLTPDPWKAQNLAWELAENGQDGNVLPVLGFTAAEGERG